MIRITQLHPRHQLFEFRTLESQPSRILNEGAFHHLHRRRVLRTPFTPRTHDVLQVRPDVVEYLVHLLEPLVSFTRHPKPRIGISGAPRERVPSQVVCGGGKRRDAVMINIRANVRSS